MATTESGTIAVLAEKPSVARDIASVLGATSKRDGYLHGNGYVVTWAIGHLAALAQPHEIEPAWRQWRRDLLPMLPECWPLIVYEKTKDQFEVVRKIVNSPRTAVQQVGWKVLDIATARKPGRAQSGGEERREEQVLPSGLKKGDPQEVVDIEAVPKKTRPPKRLTEGTLLTAMETTGKTLDEKELSDAMKETGLGTPATRAAIIEVLLNRGYIIRSGKRLKATDKGIRLIEIVPMTGQWEAYLTRIQRGKAHLEPFMKGIEDYVREVVGKVGHVQPPAKTPIVAPIVPVQTRDASPEPRVDRRSKLATR